MSLLREAWVRIHWFVGITAGSVLVVVGLSGAVLSFRAEIVEALNPGLRHVAAPSPGAMPLAPAELVERLRAGSPQRRIATLTVSAEAGRPARANFAPPPGERRGETRAVDPYTGALLPHPRGDDFFEFVERLHRWLLLPREDGKPVTGTLAAGLLVLAFSGLYLRWPRRPLSWRAWLRIDFGLKGRAFLWSLHAVVGTVALPLYVVSAATGVYWGFDAVRTWVDGAAGEGREVRMQRMGAAPGTAPADAAAAGPDLPRVWSAFQAATAGDWTQVTLRLPARGASQVEATYLRADAAHERARNRLYLDAATGAATRHERYADKPLAGRLVHSVYPLHMGTYWGLPGRVAMALSSAALALFAITGWWMYLARRRTGAQVRRERARLAATAPGGVTGGAAPVLLAFASQTGHAERIALRTAAALQAAGVAVDVRPLAALDADLLRSQRHLLIVASTFGDGDPPDAAHGVVERLDREAGAAGLPHLRYGLLALGDVHYATFCGFGRTLRHHLQGLGAQPLFPMIEVDDRDPAALARWTHEVGAALGVDLDASALHPAQASHDEPAFEAWRLVRRTLLNPGSQGEPLYEIELRRDGDGDGASGGASGAPADARPVAPAGALAWAPGALAELRPPQAGGTAQSAAPRRYSVASLPNDGCIQLLVRQVRHAGGLGLASGWLTEHAPLGASVALRLRPNPAFALVEDDRPCLFVGNGSGFGGLRGHLRERVRRGHHRNWLVHGERQASHDDFVATELAGWQRAGAVERADRVFSRDTPVRRHVQDRLREAADALRRWVDDGGVIYVCGSLAGMAPGVDRALRDVLGDAKVDDLLAENRYRRDVY
ncbi:PepSY domain-containing protein [Variovorax sp. PvP013]|uniref:PepSY domain-containing protein n=1 Tax=Variovorax sp. PvP013 TaxID=3156435 RepID=UPI003D1FF386